MKKLIGSVIAAALTVMGLGVVANMAPVAAAVNCPAGSVNTTADTYAGCNVKADAQGQDLMGTLTTIINVIVAFVGFIAVVVIIIGGINYSLSQGDAGKVKKAKDTILYGVIGLVVALLAFAIVNFVLANIFKA